MAKLKDDTQAPPPPKIVGPNITGKREEYRLERRLQSGLFGGVYEAKGLSTGRMFAVKVLHRSELHKAQRASSLEFCEVPLSEITYMELMRGHEHIMQVEDNFEDQYCHYIVFELARGGDLLEALKLKPRGFEEQQAQFLIGQAARGLAALHDRHLAMQDVSLENMLLHVKEDGEYQVKIIDPGQAVQFEVDESGEEIPVKFHGFVGKSFRPPEIHQKQHYYGTKVDAWCLGWSTFYLLAAQPLFLSASPAEQDADWELFENNEFATLFRQKATSCSQLCMDFILKLLVIDPRRRMSVREALQHDWLRDSNSRPMYAPKEFMPMDTPDKRTVERPQGVTPTKEAGHSSPTIGGNFNGNYDELRSQGGLSTAAPNFSGSGFRGGGSLGGGLSGHFAASNGSGGLAAATPGGLHSGIHTSEFNRHRSSQSGVAPAWKMAPPSRAESPGPGITPLIGRNYQGGGSTGAPTPIQYAPSPARTSSPFGPVPRNSGFAPLQRRSPSPPPRPNASLMRNTTGTNVYGGTRDPATSWPDLGNQSGTSAASQNSHTPRPARMSGVSSNSLVGRGASEQMEYTPKATVPTQMGSTREGRDPNLDAAQSQGAQVDGDVRFGQMGGSGRHASAAAAGANALRPNSPMTQQTVLVRSQNGRGLSPSPIRSGTGIDTTWAVPSPVQRSGSPMTHQHQAATLGNEAARGNMGGSVSQFWPSPRAASPNSTVFRAGPEAFSRGRSHTRALSPSQQLVGGLGSTSAQTQGVAGGMVRTLSPSGFPSRTAGIAWSPVPPSPPAPTRSISPQPSLLQPSTSSVPSLRWVP